MKQVESLSKNYYKVQWTVITNCDSFFIYKVLHGLLQIATGITKWDDYYKLRQYIRFNILSPLFDVFNRIIELG